MDDDVNVNNQISSLNITANNEDNRFKLIPKIEPNGWFLHVANLDYEMEHDRTITLMALNSARTQTGDCHQICPLETLFVTTTVHVIVLVS